MQREGIEEGKKRNRNRDCFIKRNRNRYSFIEKIINRDSFIDKEFKQTQFYREGIEIETVA